MRVGCTGDSCCSLLLSLFFSSHLFVMLNSFGRTKENLFVLFCAVAKELLYKTKTIMKMNLWKM